MAQTQFTVAIDESVLALAQRIADAEHQPIGSVFEAALIDYAGRKGLAIETPLVPEEVR